jgi:hypothetical protein
MDELTFTLIIIGIMLAAAALLWCILRRAYKSGTSVVIRDRPEDETLGI